ncbi:3436_t:CDS:2 [Ambispora gerdemannii]|uniref:3436_t:CDS:1 n=1 Tax=Ambispora gerdemannii TaxID=144530 RepID=A0A9N8V5H1_9GLOM|nr:3436_t:CDS:2 [Ambispora gerdemannii]
MINSKSAKSDSRESPNSFNTCSTTTTNGSAMPQQQSTGYSRRLSSGQHHHLIGSQESIIGSSTSTSTTQQLPNWSTHRRSSVGPYFLLNQQQDSSSYNSRFNQSLLSSPSNSRARQSQLSISNSRKQKSSKSLINNNDENDNNRRPQQRTNRRSSLPPFLGSNYKNFNPAAITPSYSSFNSYSGSFNKRNDNGRQRFPPSSISRSNNNNFNGQKSPSQWSSPSARRLSYSEIQWQNSLSNRTFGNYSQRPQPNMYPSVTNSYQNNASSSQASNYLERSKSVTPSRGSRHPLTTRVDHYETRRLQEQDSTPSKIDTLNKSEESPSIDKATIHRERDEQQVWEDSPPHLESKREKNGRQHRSNLSTNWGLPRNGLSSKNHSIKGALSESANRFESENSIDLSKSDETKADASDQETITLGRESPLKEDEDLLGEENESMNPVNPVDQTESVNGNSIFDERRESLISDLGNMAIDAKKEPQDSEITKPFYIEDNPKEIENYSPAALETPLQKESILPGHKERRTWQQKLFMQSHRFRAHPQNRYSDDYSYFYPSNDYNQEPSYNNGNGYLANDKESLFNNNKDSTEFVGSAPDADNYPLPNFLRRKKRKTQKFKLNKKTSLEQRVKAEEAQQEEPYLVNLIFKICDALEIECKLYSPIVKNKFNCYSALLRVPVFKKTFGAHNEIREIVRETVAEMAIDHFRQRNPDTFKKVLEKMGSDVEELDHYCCVYKGGVIGIGGGVKQAQIGKKVKKISKALLDQPLLSQNNNKLNIVETKDKGQLSALLMQGYGDTSSKDVLDNVQEDKAQVLGNEILKAEKETLESTEVEMKTKEEDQISIDQLDESKLSELPQHQVSLEPKETADQTLLSTKIIEQEIISNVQQQEELEDLIIIGDLMNSTKDTQQNDVLLEPQLSNTYDLSITSDSVENTAAALFICEHKDEKIQVLDQASDSQEEKNDHKEPIETVTQGILDMQDQQQQQQNFNAENNNYAQHETTELLEQLPPPQDDLPCATINEEDAATIRNG